MNISSMLRRCAVLAAVGAALAACAAPPPPAPPPAAPPVALSPKLIEQAAAYRHFVDQAAAIEPGFTQGEDVAKSLKTAVAYEPQQLIRGVIAYAAVVALQDPAFAAGVRTYAADPAQRQTIAYEIMKDPAYAVGFAGSGSAAARVTKALDDDGRRLFEHGRAVRLAAYQIQREPWSKGPVANPAARLANVKSLSSTPATGEVEQILRLSQAVSGALDLGVTADPAQPPYTPTVVRGLAVAALAILGHANEADLQYVMPLVAEPNAANCLALSKLNLYQCLAVAKPHYEDVFCLGVHALMDTGKCLVKNVGQPEPQDVRGEPLVIAGGPSAPAASKPPVRDPLAEAVKPAARP